MICGSDGSSSGGGVSVAKDVPALLPLESSHSCIKCHLWGGATCFIGMNLHALLPLPFVSCSLRGSVVCFHVFPAYICFLSLCLMQTRSVRCFQCDDEAWLGNRVQCLVVIVPVIRNLCQLQLVTAPNKHASSITPEHASKRVLIHLCLCAVVHGFVECCVISISLVCPCFRPSFS